MFIVVAIYLPLTQKVKGEKPLNSPILTIRANRTINKRRNRLNILNLESPNTQPKSTENKPNINPCKRVKSGQKYIFTNKEIAILKTIKYLNLRDNILNSLLKKEPKKIRL
jgi:hypothetical protein